MYPANYFFQSLFALSFCSALPSLAAPTASAHNNFACRSARHPNPVVILHGLGATYYEDLNFFEAYLQTLSYCTFSLTYGAYPDFPFVGGLKPIADSGTEVASFIRAVQQNTGAPKIDIVGHSEGAFLSLYVPKLEDGISSVVDKIVAIAPPTHGTSFANLIDLAYIGGNLTRSVVSTVLDVVGCPACDDLSNGGAAIATLNDGTPIVQEGNTVTIIISREDELVTPVQTSQVNEAGVDNLYVQDFCPNDRTGHVGEAYDTNVWSMIINSLESTPTKLFVCSFGGVPGK